MRWLSWVALFLLGVATAVHAEQPVISSSRLSRSNNDDEDDSIGGQPLAGGSGDRPVRFEPFMSGIATFQVRLTFPDLDYIDDYSNKNSSAYRELESTILSFMQDVYPPNYNPQVKLNSVFGVEAETRRYIQAGFLLKLVNADGFDGMSYFRLLNDRVIRGFITPEFSVRKDLFVFKPLSSTGEGPIRMDRQNFCDEAGGEYFCKMSGSCIHMSQRCDRNFDCPNAEDEFPQDCTCAPDQFRCTVNRQCLAKLEMCDGEPDCPDGEDEDDCTELRPCEPDEFRCPSSGDCQSKYRICDGRQDCDDGWDESRCPTEPLPGQRCLTTQYYCSASSAPPVCIDRAAHCDSTKDCAQGEDEVGCDRPSNFLEYPQNEIEKKVGDSLELTCAAQSVPPSLITWRYNWAELPNDPRFVASDTFNRGTLKIRNLAITDGGIYTCQAMNELGRNFAPNDATLVVTAQDELFCLEPNRFNRGALSPSDCLECMCSGVGGDRLTCYSARLYRTRIALGQESTLVRAGDWAVVEEVRPRFLPDSNGLSVDDYQRLDPVTTYYFSLPAAFLGNQLRSFGGKISYKIAYETLADDRVSVINAEPFVAISGNGKALFFWSNVTLQPNSVLQVDAYLLPHNFRVRASGDTAPLSQRSDLMTILADVKNIMIRASYDRQQTSVQIYDIYMESATENDNGQAQVHTVESCNCPPEYDGDSCERCRPGYWRAKRAGNAEADRFTGSCIACECNQHATDCDAKTGRCIDCRHNTEGQRCDRCKSGFYGDPVRNPGVDACQPCPCPLTSDPNQFSKRCEARQDGSVRCLDCPEGHEGDRCERCAPGYVGDPTRPGQRCIRQGSAQCDSRGTLSSDGGRCNCKRNVQGESCSQCVPGSFYLNEMSSDGCLRCWCNDLSTECSSSQLRLERVRFFFPNIESELAEKVVLTNLAKTVSVVPELLNAVTITLSDPQLLQGELFWKLNFDSLLASYGSYVHFSLYQRPSPNAFPSDNALLVIVDGVERARFEGEPVIVDQFNSFKVLLHHDLFEMERGRFLRLLSSNPQLLIRATYAEGSAEVALRDVFVETATRQGDGDVAWAVETCQCPPGSFGASCEMSCDPGFEYRDGQCQRVGRCQCNGYSDDCHPVTGECYNCRGNTEGRQCDRCKAGFYNRGVDGLIVCEPCQCPSLHYNYSPTCVGDGFGTYVCDRCQEGYQGFQCQECAPDFVGDPLTSEGCRRPEPLSLTWRGEPEVPQENGYWRIYCTVSGGQGPYKFDFTRSDGAEMTVYPFEKEVVTDILMSEPENQGAWFLCRVTDASGAQTDAIIDQRIVAPTLQTNVTRLTVYKGETVTLDASVISESSSFTFSYSRADAQPLPSGAEQLQIGDRTIRLRFVAQSKDDGGQFVLRVSNAGGEAQTVIEVIVIDRPPTPAPPKLWVWIEGNETVSVDEGTKTLTLVCRIKFKGENLKAVLGRRFLPPNGVQRLAYFTLSHVNLGNDGTYTCLGLTPVGQAQDSVRIRVRPRRLSPEIEVISPRELRVLAGDQLQFSCRFKNSETQQIYRQDGAFIDPRMVFIQGDQITFFVDRAESKHSGTYTCMATSRFSKATDAVRVTVDALPDPGVFWPTTAMTQLIRSTFEMFQSTISPATTVPGPLSGGDRLPRSYEVVFFQDLNRIEGNVVELAAGDKAEIRVDVEPQPPRRFQIQWKGMRPGSNWFVSDDRLIISSFNTQDARTLDVMLTDPNDGASFQTKLHIRQRLARRPMKIEVIPSKIYVPEGGSGEAKCIVDSYPPVNYIEWRCSSDETSRERIIKEKYNSTARFEYRLRVVDFEPSVDRASCLCYADNGVEQMQGTLTIELRTHAVPPQLQVLPALKQEKGSGESTYFQCLDVGGYPKAEIIWSAVDGPLSPRTVLDRDGILNFTNIQKEDEGRYKCAASNEAGKDMKLVTLIWTRPTFQVMILAPPEQSIYIGQRFQVNCFSDKTGLNNNTGIYFQWTGPNGFVGSINKENSYLNIRPVIAAQFGTYVCSGWRLGKDGRPDPKQIFKQNFTLVQLPTPPPELVEPAAPILLGAKIRLQCSVKNQSPNDLFLWSRMDENGFKSSLPTTSEIVDNHTLVLNRVRESDQGYYTCTYLGDQAKPSSKRFPVFIDKSNKGKPSATTLPLQPVASTSSLRPEVTTQPPSVTDTMTIPSELPTTTPKSVIYQTFVYAAVGTSVDLWPCPTAKQPRLTKDQQEVVDNIDRAGKVLRMFHVTKKDFGGYSCTYDDNGQTKEMPFFVVVGDFVPKFENDPTSKNARSYLRLDGQVACDKIDPCNIELAFRADRLDGTLLYAGERVDVDSQYRTPDFLALSLNNGTLGFSMSLGSGAAQVNYRKRIETDKWYTVRLRREKYVLEIRVDSDDPQTAEMARGMIGLNLEPEIYVGGVPDVGQVSKAAPKEVAARGGFSGIIAYLKMNGQLREFKAADNVEPFIACEAKTCKNHATCHPSAQLEGFKCMCYSGFTGRHCEVAVSESCSPQLCGPGTCQQLSNSDSKASYTFCHCPPSHTGARCERRQNITMVRLGDFGPSVPSYIKVPLNDNDLTSETELSIKFKPEKSPPADGLLALAVGQRGQQKADYLAVFIRAGKINLKYDLGSGPLTLSSQSNIDDQWTEVLAKRSGTDGSLTVNGFQVKGKAPGSTKGLNVQQWLWVGGASASFLSSVPVPVKKSFNGCVAAVQLRDAQLLSEVQDMEGMNVRQCSGEIPKSCDFEPCLNGGTCMPVTSEPTGDFVCSCQEGFEGSRCELGKNPCAVNDPCGRDEFGDCLVTDPTDVSVEDPYQCLCYFGRGGKNCENKVSIDESIYFSGQHSWLSLVKYFDPSSNLVAMKLRALSLNGLIFAYGTREPDYIALFLEDGHLAVAYDLGSGATRLNCKDKLALDVENEILLERDKHTVKLSLNGREVGKVKSEGFSGLNSKSPLVHFGGLSRNAAPAMVELFEQLPAFNGCIRDVRFGRMASPVNFRKDSVAAESRNVVPCT